MTKSGNDVQFQSHERSLDFLGATLISNAFHRKSKVFSHTENPVPIALSRSNSHLAILSYVAGDTDTTLVPVRNSFY